MSLYHVCPAAPHFGTVTTVLLTTGYVRSHPYLVPPDRMPFCMQLDHLIPPRCPPRLGLVPILMVQEHCYSGNTDLKATSTCLNQPHQPCVVAC
ncbi:hypothetical protein Pyn_31459 [Prunus yedoensis var. nudiflora]|uniref:Uncharacterized protein n=1 Tax=Prunus yedoensis var. nudiflora TaxID=2094558 RepID=A0A314ZVJ2_PRUYE|nr:hypothetical protein Pyn_31459 [Prunus yedoensis var. nudiflora]